MTEALRTALQSEPRSFVGECGLDHAAIYAPTNKVEKDIQVN